MAAPAILKIDIIASAQKAIDAFKDTTDAAGGTEGAFKSIGKVLGPALGTAAVIGFGKASVTAAQESEVATARLTQVFSSMGDSTGQAAKAAIDYAGALSKKIGVEDESIMQAQAQLATFGAVSDETARQAGIFDQATAAAADLAAAGFGTLDSNAVQLGKALQDPTKGMTALARSGVTFTDAQKDQIKALQESGNLLEAQKIVLKAVQSQVGGTAEATATSTGKMTVAFGEVQEQLGGKLLPVISTVADFFTKYMNVLIPLAGVLLAVMAATKLFQIAQQAMQVVTAAGTVIQWAWNAAVSANPIMLIVIALVAVVAAIILAYNKVDWFRAFVDAAFSAIVDAFNWIVDAAKAVFNWIANNWPILLAILTGPFGIAILLITKNFDTIKDVAKAMVDWVSDRFQDLVGFVSRVAQTFSGVLGSIADAIRLPIDAARAMFDFVSGKFNDLLDIARGLKDKISGFIGGVVDVFTGPLNAIIRAWNSIRFEVPSVDVGPVHFGGQSIGVPQIPQLARGGRVLRTGLALVHEGESFSGVGRSLGGTTINVNVTTTGLGADAPQIQRAVVDALRGWQQRNGALPVTVAGSP